MNVWRPRWTTRWHHIDNLGILSAAVSGRSSVLDVNPLLTGLHLLLTNLRVTSWWEHVDTHANPADGGSRQGTSCKWAKRLGIPLEWVKFSICAGLHGGRWSHRVVEVFQMFFCIWNPLFVMAILCAQFAGDLGLCAASAGVF